MKSKIRVELDDLNNPIIEITIPHNADEDDLRDKVLTKFLNGAVYFELEVNTPTSLYKGLDKDETKYILRPVKKDQLYTPSVQEVDNDYISMSYCGGYKGLFVNSPYKHGDVIGFKYFMNKASNDNNSKVWYCSTKPCNGHIGAIIDCGAKMNMGTSGTSGTPGTSGRHRIVRSGTSGGNGTTGLAGTGGNGSSGTAGTSGSSAIYHSSGSAGWASTAGYDEFYNHGMEKKLTGSNGSAGLSGDMTMAEYMLTQRGTGSSGSSGFWGT